MPASDPIANAYSLRLPALSELAGTLSNTLQDELKNMTHVDRCSFRLKRLDQFLKKAQSGRYQDPLSEIEDQVAGRVLVHLVPDVPPVENVLKQLWGSVEFRRVEPGNARQFDYESWHYIFVIPDHAKPAGWDQLSDMPTTFEMQVRTLFMHAYAEPQHDWGYKSLRALSHDETRQLAWVAASAWGADRAFSGLRRDLQSGPPGPAGPESPPA